MKNNRETRRLEIAKSYGHTNNVRLRGLGLPLIGQLQNNPAIGNRVYTNNVRLRGLRVIVSLKCISQSS